MALISLFHKKSSTAFIFLMMHGLHGSAWQERNNPVTYLNVEQRKITKTKETTQNMGKRMIMMNKENRNYTVSNHVSSKENKKTHEDEIM